LTLRIPLILLLGILPGAYRGGCDEIEAALWSELEDLQELKTRILIDFTGSSYGSCRLMYVENRASSDPQSDGRGSCDPLLQPQRWALGIASPLLTAGPVSLGGILAQLYNPLAHGPQSEVFTDSAGLSLDSDLEVSSRTGAQLELIHGRWRLLGMYKEQTGAQLGSVIAFPFGRSIGCTVVGLICQPPDRLEHEHSWYARQSLFPGGLIGHLAGSLTWQHDRLRFSLVSAASAGQWVEPGTFVALNTRLSAAPVDLALLFGFCSPRYFTPEGEPGDLGWIIAARTNLDFPAVHLRAGCSKELAPLPPLPQGFRGSRDRLDVGIEVLRKAASHRAWNIGVDAGLEQEWSPEGERSLRHCLEVGSTVDWGRWDIAATVSQRCSGDSERIPAVRIVAGWDPPWGKVELEAGYEHGPKPGFDLAAALEASGEDKRFYLRLATKELMRPDTGRSGWKVEDWPMLFTFRFGWEAKLKRQLRRKA
jgi:hypothetical protein